MRYHQFATPLKRTLPTNGRSSRFRYSTHRRDLTAKIKERNDLILFTHPHRRERTHRRDSAGVRWKTQHTYTHLFKNAIALGANLRLITVLHSQYSGRKYPIRYSQYSDYDLFSSIYIWILHVSLSTKKRIRSVGGSGLAGHKASRRNLDLTHFCCIYVYAAYIELITTTHLFNRINTPLPVPYFLIRFPQKTGKYLYFQYEFICLKFSPFFYWFGQIASPNRNEIIYRSNDPTTFTPKLYIVWAINITIVCVFSTLMIAGCSISSTSNELCRISYEDYCGLPPPPWAPPWRGTLYLASLY